MHLLTTGFPIELETEYLLDRSILDRQDVASELARFSPSHAVLQSILQKGIGLDDLTWREFERLIAELLEHEGYEIELMSGTKDGGVDVVATMNLQVGGSFRALWQAKKEGAKNKVGLSTIRELADTRNECRASKGII